MVKLPHEAHFYCVYLLSYNSIGNIIKFVKVVNYVRYGSILAMKELKRMNVSCASHDSDRKESNDAIHGDIVVDTR